jgi:hypothetical protein
MLIFAAGSTKSSLASSAQIKVKYLTTRIARGSKKTLRPRIGAAAMFDLKISPVKMLIYRLLCKQPPRLLASCANFAMPERAGSLL